MDEKGFMTRFFDQMQDQMSVLHKDLGTLQEAVASIARYEDRADGLEEKLDEIELILERIVPIVDSFERLRKAGFRFLAWGGVVSSIAVGAWLVHFFGWG